MNIIQKIIKSVDDFLSNTIEYNKKEGIIFLIIYFLIIIGIVAIGGIFSKIWVYIGMAYISTSFMSVMSLDNDNDAIRFIICTYLSPYIFLMMLLDKIFKKFVPYRGDNPMMIRSYKIRTLKRKAIVNKIKYWKR